MSQRDGQPSDAGPANDPEPGPERHDQQPADDASPERVLGDRQPENDADEAADPRRDHEFPTDVL